MICDYVSRDDIRAIEIGQIATFCLPNAKAKESARVQFSQMKKLEHMDFERIPTSELYTISYKRLK